MKKTLFSVLLIIAMLLNVFPVTAFAHNKNLSPSNKELDISEKNDYEFDYQYFNALKGDCI